MTAADLLTRTAVLAGCWALLTRGDAGSWVVGVPTVLAAVGLSRALTPTVSWQWSPAGALRFAAFFLWQSLRGGLDVARRALHPGLPLHPGLVRVPLRVPPGTARRWLAIVLSLLPGTVLVELDDDSLLLHTIDDRSPTAAEVAAAEARVAAVFRMRLPAAPGEVR